MERSEDDSFAENDTRKRYLKTPSSGYGESDGADFLSILSLISRRRYIIASIMLLGMGISAYYGLTRVPVYAGEARILIEAENKVINLDSVVAGVGADNTAMETEINLLLSDHMLDQLARGLYPDGPPQYASDDDGSPFQFVATLIKSALAFGTSDQGEEEQQEPSDETDIWRQVKGELERNLTVQRDGISSIIYINYASEDKIEASEIPNLLADIYIQDQIESKKKVTGEATSFLKERVEKLGEALREAEKEVENYRRKNTIHESVEFNAANARMEHLVALLLDTRSRRKEAETRLANIEQKRVSGGIFDPAFQSDQLTVLQGEASRLNRRLAELGIEYGQKHPMIVNLKTEQSEVNRSIEAEQARIALEKQNEISVLKHRENLVQEDIDELKVKNEEVARARVELSQLERHAQVSRDIYENFLRRMTETREQEGIVQSNARVIARAAVPNAPSNAGSLQYIIFGIAASASVAGGLALLRDRVDRSLRSTKEVEQILDLPCLSLIPLLKKRDLGKKKPHQYLIEKPLSAYAESIRAVEAHLTIGSDFKEQNKIIQVTSSLPNEGKTTFALSLATSLAFDGYKTLIVDLDFRHPSIGKEVDLTNSTCLIDFLEGNCEIDNIKLCSLKSGCDVMGIKSLTRHPSKLLSSKRLKYLLNFMRNEYDFIIADSTPTLGMVDSGMINSLVDTAIFVVHWNKITPETAADANKELMNNGANISGAVITQVDFVKHRRYGYRGVDSVHDKLKNYYVN